MQRDALLIEEMIDAAQEAIRLVAGDDVEILASDRRRRDALLWNFTVLGEAASRVSPQTKERFPTVAWTPPTDLRNRIVHGYWSIDMGIIHTTVNDDLPALVTELQQVLRDLDTHTEQTDARS